MAHPRALAMGLALALTSSDAFIVPSPTGYRSSPSVGSSAKLVVGSHGAPARTSSVPALKLSKGFSIGKIADLVKDVVEGEDDDTTLPTLPQDPSADQEGRKSELEDAKELYEWNYEDIPQGAPYLKEVPDDEQPSTSWTAKAAESAGKILLGLVKSVVTGNEVVEAIGNPDKAKSLLANVQELISKKYSDDRPDEISDYEDLHATPITTPDSVYDWEDDEAFARLRLQGANCVQIQKCTDAHRAKLTILDTDSSYQDLKTKVDSLMEAGKLFVVDHEMLDGLKTNKLDDKIDRYLATGIALFEVVDDELLPLRPLGIQLSQGKTATPIFTPDDPEYTWKIAKACFEAADSIIHEVISHLGYTHVVLEGAMVSANRCFPSAHPIYKLIKPHLEGTAFINDGAQNSLITSGGTVDRLQAIDIEEMYDVVVEKVVARISKDFSPPEELAARGMTTEDFPGRYPYRDAGTMYWDAIYTWVDEYLKIYYTSEADVEGDYELEGFVDEMVNKAYFTWLNEFSGSSDKRGVITKVLATLIYTASVNHAAVNFPQMPSTSYVPSCPGSMYAPPPTDKGARTFEEFLAYLPALDISAEQVAISTFLGSIFYTQLGEYGSSYFTDSRVVEPLAKFQENIVSIGSEIEDTNAYLINGWRKRDVEKRKAANFAYFTLLPDKIPQSINI